MGAARPRDWVEERLREAGIPVTSVWDLVNSKERYPSSVVSILLEALPKETDPREKEGIVRALTVKEARGVAAEPLVRSFAAVTDPDSSLKWAIGNALAVVADDSVFDDIVLLASDKKHGKGRQMLVESLANMKNPQVVDVLIGLLGDEEVAGHALVALRKLKSKKARPYIEPFLNHPMPWVRREAKKALRNIDSVSRKSRGTA